MVSPIVIIWLISQSILFISLSAFILALLYLLWRRMHVSEPQENLSVTLESDVVDVAPEGKVTFTGIVTDTGEPVSGVPGVLDVTAPDGAKSSIPFTSGDDGKFSIVWDAVLPAGVWSFLSSIEGFTSDPLTITLRTGRHRRCCDTTSNSNAYKEAMTY
jgi:hypothetical protein